MGTFADYCGNCTIPEERRQKFRGDMVKLLYYGGMMGFEEIRMYGYELALLKPVSLSPGGEVRFHYNYFEDDAWEAAGFDPSTAHLWSNKIGSSEFRNVMMTAYTLCELNSSGAGFPLVNGEIFEAYDSVAWINHILGTEYSLEKRFLLWENAELYALTRVGDYETPFSDSDLADLVPRELLFGAGGTELAGLCYIAQGTSTLTKAEVIPGTYPADVYACKQAICGYLDAKGNTPDGLWALLRMDRETRGTQPQGLLSQIAEMTMYLPARVIVYLAAEHMEQEFWGIWKELREGVYHDEVMKRYAPPELEAERKAVQAAPIPGIKTSTFLRQNSWFTFLDTPEELRDKPRYYVSDDDRMYWWDGSDEVVLSEEADRWLNWLAERHAELMRTEGETAKSVDSVGFLKEFLALLSEIKAHYQRLFPFQTMFYDFLRNSEKREYRAAVALLRELHWENYEAGKAIEYRKSGWDVTSRKATFNAGRLNMKRYMSVMANRELRKKYFGF